MNIDEKNTIYVGIDPTNAEIRILMPRGGQLQLEEMWIDSPDPDDREDYHRFKLLQPLMDETVITLP